MMAHAGAGSRRACEELILQGRVTVNGQVVRELGVKIDPEKDEVRLDGQVLRLSPPVYYMINKPRGVISTASDEQGRPSVVSIVSETGRRIYPVGRLDADSVGLILLTNDGTLAERLTHPRYEIPKTYEVRVKGTLTPDTVERLKKGVWLSEGRARIEGIEVVKDRRSVSDLVLTIHEGKNREIRRVMAKVGHPVLWLKRVAMGSLRLGELKEGRHRKLTPEEVQGLYRLAEEAERKVKESGAKPPHRARRRKPRRRFIPRSGRP
jgi:23S rRNA pseudouridine2605 synthase